MPRNNFKFRAEDVEKALRASMGIYTLAAQKLQCAPNTIKNYVKRSKKLQAVEQEILTKNLDLAETKLLKAISDGNLTATIFYLKCKGKDRGYIERGEIVAPEGPIVAAPSINVYLPQEDPE